MSRTVRAIGPLPDQTEQRLVPMIRAPGRDAAEVRQLLDVGALRPAAALARSLGSAVGQSPEVGVGDVWPVVGPLAGLLPDGGLRRGSVVQVLGSTSLLWAVLAAASQAGAWAALVGMPEAGILAAVEHGVILDRLALVPHPGPEWPAIVAALLDGLDLVAVRPPAQAAPSMGRRLVARARQRAAVLLPTGVWDGAETTLRASDAEWYGLGQGRGRLRCRQLTVSAEGRGRLARPRRVRVWLPDLDGTAIAAAGVGTSGTVRHLWRAA